MSDTRHMIRVQQFRPCADWLVLEPDAVEEVRETEGGLMLPDSARPRMVPRTGTVLAVGPDVKRTMSGERVIFSAYAGTEIEMAGRTVRAMQDCHIIAGID